MIPTCLTFRGFETPERFFLTNQVKGASKRVKGASKRVEGAPKRVEGAPKRVEGAPKRVEGAPKRVEGASMRVYTRFFADQKKFHFKPFFFVIA